jgi:hypothetical protein
MKNAVATPSNGTISNGSNTSTTTTYISSTTNGTTTSHITGTTATATIIVHVCTIMWSLHIYLPLIDTILYNFSNTAEMDESN